jgi:RNA polymerase sigma factor (sigma-70 family)
MDQYTKQNLNAEGIVLTRQFAQNRADLPLLENFLKGRFPGSTPFTQLANALAKELRGASIVLFLEQLTEMTFSRGHLGTYLPDGPEELIRIVPDENYLRAHAKRYGCEHGCDLSKDAWSFLRRYVANILRPKLLRLRITEHLDDCVSIVIVGIFESLPHFEGRNGCRLATWCYAVAVQSNLHRGLDLGRNPDLQPLDLDTVAAFALATREIEAVEMTRECEAALSLVGADEIDRTILRLEAEGWTTAAIGRELNLAESSVRVRKKRLRDALRSKRSQLLTRKQQL